MSEVIRFQNPGVTSLFRTPADTIVGSAEGVFALDPARDARLIENIRAEMERNPNSGWTEGDPATLEAVIEAVDGGDVDGDDPASIRDVSDPQPPKKAARSKK